MMSVQYTTAKFLSEYVQLRTVDKPIWEQNDTGELTSARCTFLCSSVKEFVKASCSPFSLAYTNC